MLYSIRSKLIASFIGVSLVVGAFSLVVGTRLLDRAVYSEASMRVSLNLNSARELYRVQKNTIEVALNITTLGYGFIGALKERDRGDLISRLERMTLYAGLDFAGIADGEGSPLCRNRPDTVPGRQNPPSNPVAGFALEKGGSVSGTFVLSREFLMEENPQLAEKARVDVIPAPGTRAGSERAVTAGLGCFVAGRIIRPIRRRVRASEQVTEGSLTPDIGPVSGGEIGVLQKAFRDMVSAVGRRRMESQNRLIMSEKQASVGRLAAGVAHEINNPLTGVLTYTHMLLTRNDLNEDVRADLRTIAEATERVRQIVKGLLDFSRQTPPAMEKANSRLSEEQALVHQEEILRVLDRAATDGDFVYKLLHHWAEALDEYPLTGAEKLALLTGDIEWIEKHTGPLTEKQKRWLQRPISPEVLKVFGW